MYWKQELEGYSDRETTEALNLWVGEWFPSVKEIRQLMDRKRELQKQAAKEAANNRPWESYKAEQSQAASEGRLATDEDYEELRAKCREIMAKAPVIMASGRAHGKTGTEASSVSAGDRAENQVPSGGGSKSENGTGVGDNADNESGCMVATGQEDD